MQIEGALLQRKGTASISKIHVVKKKQVQVWAALEEVELI